MKGDEDVKLKVKGNGRRDGGLRQGKGSLMMLDALLCCPCCSVVGCPCCVAAAGSPPDPLFPYVALEGKRRGPGRVVAGAGGCRPRSLPGRCRVGVKGSDAVAGPSRGRQGTGNAGALGQGGQSERKTANERAGQLERKTAPPLLLMSVLGRGAGWI